MTLTLSHLTCALLLQARTLALQVCQGYDAAELQDTACLCSGPAGPWKLQPAAWPPLTTPGGFHISPIVR